MQNNNKQKKCTTNIANAKQKQDLKTQGKIPAQIKMCFKWIHCNNNDACYNYRPFITWFGDPCSAVELEGCKFSTGLHKYILPFLM